ncbi:hypothetical protein K438DRAFT_1821947 [Mycena galopus ATCC 62051]|nr:hypothetical protein K438DRAFT_1821947 [Mycena galopus ATCC 62051]
MASAPPAPLLSTEPSMHICGVSVPDDVLGHILASLPDFRTLHAALGVCGTWTRVFEMYPKIVTLSVACNLLGPALPYAMLVIRYKIPVSEDKRDDEEDPEAAEDGELSPEERMRLQRNAETVAKLEKFFSFEHNGRRKLTGPEYHRFARAMYRVMLYCQRFYHPLTLHDMRAVEAEPGLLDKIQASRYAMLDEYSTPHLLEIQAVVVFLYQLIDETLDQDEWYRLRDICFATGPAVILQAYVEQSSTVYEQALEEGVMASGEDDEENALFYEFFFNPLEKVFDKREVEAPEMDLEPGFADIFDMDAILVEDDEDEDEDEAILQDNEDTILDEDIPQIAECAQCGVDAELWNESNWENRTSADLRTLLPGRLNGNKVETEALVEILTSPTGTTDVVISEIYAMLEPEYVSWEKDESLCSACLDKLIGAHLHLWFYKRKVAAGNWKTTENCWYGYNCNTQVHKMSHAREKNHLCKPIR